MEYVDVWQRQIRHSKMILQKERIEVYSGDLWLFQSGLSKEFWAEAIVTANYLTNQFPNKGLNGCILAELFYKVYSNVCRIREFFFKNACVKQE